MGRHDPALKAVLATIEDVKAKRLSLSAAYHLLGEPTVLPLGSTYGVSSDVGPLRLPEFDIGCRILQHFCDQPDHDVLSYAEVKHYRSEGLGKWEGIAAIRRPNGDLARPLVRYCIDYLPGNGKPVHLVLVWGDGDGSGGGGDKR